MSQATADDTRDAARGTVEIALERYSAYARKLRTCWPPSATNTRARAIAEAGRIDARIASARAILKRDADLLRSECEKRSLPVDLATLLRHIENNHAATRGAMHDQIASARERQHVAQDEATEESANADRRAEERDRLDNAASQFAEAADWLVRCLTDVTQGKVVRGLPEAEGSYKRLREALAREVAHG